MKLETKYLESNSNKWKLVTSVCFYLLVFFGCTRHAAIPGLGLFREKVSAEEQSFYNAVRFGTVEEVEQFLGEGHSPDYMNGGDAIPRIDNNPLWRLCNNLNYEKYEKSKLFIEYGADVKKRPYMYKILFNTPIMSDRYPNIKSRVQK